MAEKAKESETASEVRYQAGRVAERAANAKKWNEAAEKAKESETASEVRYQAERVAERASNAKKWKEAAEKAEMVVKTVACKRFRTRSSFADNHTKK
jgi:hypothetical protein